jgi:hypothetical protein
MAGMLDGALLGRLTGTTAGRTAGMLDGALVGTLNGIATERPVPRIGDTRGAIPETTNGTIGMTPAELLGALEGCGSAAATLFGADDAAAEVGTTAGMLGIIVLSPTKRGVPALLDAAGGGLSEELGNNAMGSLAGAFDGMTISGIADPEFDAPLALLGCEPALVVGATDADVDTLSIDTVGKTTTSGSAGSAEDEAEGIEGGSAELELDGDDASGPERLTKGTDTACRLTGTMYLR